MLRFLDLAIDPSEIAHDGAGVGSVLLPIIIIGAVVLGLALVTGAVVLLVVLLTGKKKKAGTPSVTADREKN